MAHESTMNGEHQHPLTNAVLRWATPFVASLTLLAACGSSSAENSLGSEALPAASVTTSRNPSISIVPKNNDHAPTVYLQVGDSPSSSVTNARYNLAFALPKKDVGIQPPNTAGLSSVLDGGHVGLSVGSWGADDKQHEAILKGWSAGLNKPQAFAQSITDTANSLHAETIDLDFEQPTLDQKLPLLGLVRTLRAMNPNRKITMAVPAFDRDAYALGKGELPAVVDRFNVMTYDYYGPWSEQAGPVADGKTTLRAIDEWVAVVGDERKISPGFPTYGYVFGGSKRAGEVRTPSTGTVESIPYTDIVARASNIQDDPNALTSTASLKGSYVSFLSPHMVDLTYRAIVTKYPLIGDAFFWDAQGFNDDYQNAVS